MDTKNYTNILEFDYQNRIFVGDKSGWDIYKLVTRSDDDNQDVEDVTVGRRANCCPWT